ncbi:hypothetical protein N7463_004366 [Penicillium fimorum]|uniref:Uncharacterized protein n=1 Tax=Penicillium fimorum TaxID=1882269 RepID=A0A9W9Y4F2_9EURO|nr:hypothetical protein N7463_004366 [Penicillium fimorum]
MSYSTLVPTRKKLLRRTNEIEYYDPPDEHMSDFVPDLPIDVAPVNPMVTDRSNPPFIRRTTSACDKLAAPLLRQKNFSGVNSRARASLFRSTLTVSAGVLIRCASKTEQ